MFPTVVCIFEPNATVLAAAGVSLVAAAVVGWLSAGFGEVHERLLVPVAIATMHVAYAFGMAYGLLAWVFFPKAFDPSGGMSQQKR